MPLIVHYCICALWPVLFSCLLLRIIHRSGRLPYLWFPAQHLIDQQSSSDFFCCAWSRGRFELKRKNPQVRRQYMVGSHDYRCGLVEPSLGCSCVVNWMLGILILELYIAIWLVSPDPLFKICTVCAEFGTNNKVIYFGISWDGRDCVLLPFSSVKIVHVLFK